MRSHIRDWRAVCGALLVIATVTSVSAARMPAASGSTWTTVKVPLPANADHTFAELSSITCASSACVAVGSYTGSAGQRGLVLTRPSARTGWKAAAAPVPRGAAADPFATLSSVACASATTCVALGTYKLPSGRTEQALLTGLGSSWTAVTPPLPSGAMPSTVTVSAVACAPGGSCVAVGKYEDKTRNPQGLLLTQSGRSWKAAVAPAPAGALASSGPALANVTCPAKGSCVADGTFYGTRDQVQGMVLTEAGSTWTATRSRDNLLSMGPVACISASRCVATAWILNNGYPYAAYLMHGSGTSWRTTKAPLPRQASGGVARPQPASIACTSSACTVVGTFNGGTGGLLLSGSGSSWKATEAPLPGNASAGRGESLTQVTCPSAKACLAAGSYVEASLAVRGLLLTGTGSSWKVIAAPLAPNGTVAQPVSIACASASTCFGVSSYGGKSSSTSALIIQGAA